jgi:hypothetical protein
MVIAGSSDQAVSLHYCEPQHPNITLFLPPSLLQYSFIRHHSTDPNTICNFAGTAPKVQPQLHNYFHSIRLLLTPFESSKISDDRSTSEILMSQGSCSHAKLLCNAFAWRPVRFFHELGTPCSSELFSQWLPLFMPQTDQHHFNRVEM